MFNINFENFWSKHPEKAVVDPFFTEKSEHCEFSRSPVDSSDSYLSSARAAMLSSPQHSPTH